MALGASVAVALGDALAVGTGDLVGVRVGDALAVGLAGAVGVAVGGDGIGTAVLTETDTVPRFESVEPSQAAKVNESLPANPASGKYSAVVPFKPAVP